MYIMGDVLRILDRFRITGRGVVYTVKISKGCIIHIGDVLLDLRGNRFEVSGIEMFRGIIAEGKSFEDMPLGLMFKQLDGVEAYGNILVKDLNDINFIFCNHPLYQRKVDEDYEVEYQEAGLHHSCALFSYEDMERGKLSLFGEEISGLTIYRGWMMKPEMYSDFYTLLEQKGIYLINTPEEYERYHTLPGWYDDFADETAQSVWETEGNVENALLKAKQLSGSYIVKDYVKSRKHEWYDACFISNIADVANTASVIKNFVERQGDSLVGGIVLRKFENLKQIGFHERSGMPISEEYRVFVYAGKVLIMDNYWTEKEDVKLSDSEISWIESIAKKIRSKDVRDNKFYDDEHATEYDEMYNSVIAFFSGETGIDNKPINEISNLTLLDQRTNRGYRNHIFPVKRNKILEKSGVESFIPLCTKNVFLKFYSKTVSQMYLWDKNDRKDYFDKMADEIFYYLSGTRKEQ